MTLRGQAERHRAQRNDWPRVVGLPLNAKLKDEARDALGLWPSLTSVQWDARAQKATRNAFRDRFH